MGVVEDGVKAAATSARAKLIEQSLAPFEATHRELLALWATLETKAQGTTAVAGVFLGATISMLTKNPASLTRNEKWLTLAIAATLVIAVLLALYSLRPRDTTLTNPEDRYRKMRDMLNLDDDSEFLNVLPDLYTEEKEAWAAAIKALMAINSSKARLLFVSHVATAAAVLGAALLVFAILDL